MLAVAPCRQLCDWVRSRASRGPDVLLACTGCGTQWLPGLGWTPQQADGSVPPAVRALDAG